ncbi:MAG: hypothetical protein B7733_03425 [Myxococcales bacterium FL481]|nr:MAG: hypothetical protein B7733_03425 [Myxococcales bacterium FL481]
MFDPRFETVSRAPAAALGLAGSRVFDVAGCLPPAPRLAIVGSRAAHRRVRRLVPAMVAAAGGCGWSIVSGGALGIDGDAHRAALAHGVPQLAVLPCGRDRPYPPDHEMLFARLVREGGGGLLFAQPQGAAPSRSMFASRNTIVVGLARAVIVAQAAVRSGSFGTGRLALRQGKRVLVGAGSRGCATLMALGAERMPAATELADLQAAIEGWLEAVVDDRPAPWTDAWPGHLQWLRPYFAERGSRGLTVDDLPDPLAGLCALTEAESRRLVEEVAPGRFVAA